LRPDEVDMTKNRLFAIAAVMAVALVGFAAAAHASAGAGHDGGACLACALCEWLSSLHG
jgi:hypothetical protein